MMDHMDQPQELLAVALMLVRFELQEQKRKDEIYDYKITPSTEFCEKCKVFHSKIDVKKVLLPTFERIILTVTI